MMPASVRQIAKAEHVTISLNNHGERSLFRIYSAREQSVKVHVFTYFSGTNFDERVAPRPGELCLTGLRVMANSPR